MKPTFNEKLIAYLALVSGLSISAVAVYYSVIGLTAIFAAAAIPIIVMGVALEVSKLVATVWLKQNWSTAPTTIKAYLMSAIVVLMIVTSMGIFGFLSKAHLDQAVPTGDVVDRVALIDEKIRTQRENIDVARKALKQMDESVDQILARSSDERGADKAAALRRQQQRERTALQRDIANAQSTIASLNDERAPIAKELRKVEAEVGPIKYIAAFVYGETDQLVLEKAVTWVIIIIVMVFDPLAVVLLLAAQTSFQQFRQRSEEEPPLIYVADVGEKPTEEEKAEIEAEVSEPVVDNKQPTVAETTASIFEQHPYLNTGFKYPEGWERVPPMVAPSEVPWPTNWTNAQTDTATSTTIEPITPSAETVEKAPVPIKQLTQERVVRTKVFPRASITVPPPETYVQNEEQTESNLWSATTDGAISSQDYKRKIQEQRERDINNYADKVRSKQMEMSDVPEEFQAIVRTKV